MIRTKQILIVGKIAAVMAWLLPLAVGAKAKEKMISPASPSQAVRLVLAPQTNLQLVVEPHGKDSVEAKIILAVPDSCKNQRYLCRFEASVPLQLLPEARYQWALRGDTLTVLSSVPLRIRTSRQNFMQRNSAPMALRFHYRNLDHAARLSGTAVANLVSAEAVPSAAPAKSDSAVAAVPAWDSEHAAPTPSPASSPSSVDSSAAGAASNGGSLGIIYVVIAILLILFFGVLSWLMAWSQRRQFKKIEAKSAAMPFSRPEHTQISAPAVVERAVTANRDAAHLKAVASPENSEPASSSSHSSLPAVVPENGRDPSWGNLLAQLHELNASIQQVIANQNEFNQRLAEITSAAKRDVSATSPQLSLFDMLNDDGGAPHGANGKTPPPQLRIQFAGDSSADKLSVNLVASSPVNLELSTNDRRTENLSVALAPSSKLRLLFANTEDNGNGNSEHARLLDSGASTSKNEEKETEAFAS
jgi:hypothetical protein